ncbi:MAG: hypothetical protein K2Y02_04730 [Burkholderiaceae bacterium]|nr:hypothetical protein [Burkholderiaceae bacterium]
MSSDTAGLAGTPANRHTPAPATPYRGHVKNLASSLADRRDHHHTVGWERGHIKFFSRETPAQLLHESGFDIDDFSGVGRVPRLWKSMIVTTRKRR